MPPSDLTSEAHKLFSAVIAMSNYGMNSRSVISTKDMFSGESGGSVQAGVGIFFQQENDGNVYVKTIVSGGAAEREGTVSVGDVIVAVDDREVVGEPLAVLRNLILGQQGTTVKLTFQRREVLPQSGVSAADGLTGL
eukprot:333778-Hanusia_phi.AAC.3